MKILIATHNQSKLKLYKSIFKDLNYTFYGLSDLNVTYEVEENGTTPEENAIRKAKEYAKISNMLTIADDTGLFIDKFPKKIQPKNHVKRINGTVLDDESLIKYYSDLFKQYGDSLDGYWHKSIAISYNGEIKIYNYKVHKIFVSKINSRRNKGFPLDSVSITPEYNKYTVDLTEEENKLLIEKENKEMFNWLTAELTKVKKEKGVFIACPISKYLTSDGIEKDFEIFIKEVLELCKKYTSNVFLALEREEFGKNKMWGDTCTPYDFKKMQETEYLIAIPEDSMGVAVELGWASAMNKEILLILDKKYKTSELVKYIHTIISGIKTEIDTSENGYKNEKEKVLNLIEEFLKGKYE
ncbi:MAG: hypothetical protein FWF46_03100 [Oscillospiraceae bacterium]|nr:hypothetical protein [Oscillospiraceae bacterium]